MVGVNSEGIVVLARNRQQWGVKVHESQRNEVITLHFVPCELLEDAVLVNKEKEGCDVSILIGDNDFRMIHKVDGVCKIENIPMFAGQVMWIAAEAPNRFSVYGRTSKMGSN